MCLAELKFTMSKRKGNSVYYKQSVLLASFAIHEMAYRKVRQENTRKGAKNSLGGF